MNRSVEVVIAGAGIAGLSAATRLAAGGAEVVCFDPDPLPLSRVGESLDWAAPRLLDELGLPPARLEAMKIATPKRELRASAWTGDRMVGRPRPWMHAWPMRFDLSTVHLERTSFDKCLVTNALSAGVELVPDRVAQVELNDDRVACVRTHAGGEVKAKWFIDATGRRRLLARQAGIGAAWWGWPRIALWTHAELAMDFEGTMLYLDAGAGDLVWAWQIPITPTRQSVGVVMPLGDFRELRETAQPLGHVLAKVLARFEGCGRLDPAAVNSARSRTYQPFVCDRVAGANWMMVGEAAAFVDPITSLGVTAALRHGVEAADAILQGSRSPVRAQRELRNYDRRLRETATLYNGAIESLVYSAAVRRAVGVRWASRAYVTLGFTVNSLYGRIHPTTRPRMVAFRVILAASRTWIASWRLAARWRAGRVAMTPVDPRVPRSG